MKVIIAGSRDLYYSPKHIDRIVQKFEESIGEMIELVCGRAIGIDTCGDDWRKKYRPKMRVEPFPYSDYVAQAVRDFGNQKMAGRVRNAAMADYADALILIWDGLSSGSSSMYEETNKRDLPVVEIIVKRKNRSRNVQHRNRYFSKVYSCFEVQ